MEDYPNVPYTDIVSHSAKLLQNRKKLTYNEYGQDHYLPVNTFTKWLKDRICTKHIRLNFEFRNDFKWLLDIIRDNQEKYDLEKLYKVIDSWQSNIPLLISSQTGSGKNTFIRKILMPKVFNENYRNNCYDKILLLSNRIALNRQSKLQYAQSIREITGNGEYVRKFEEELQDKGIDRHSDFGFLTICSYKQLIKYKYLDCNEYKYIICDECHFFTSDATFNYDTDRILNYIVTKGQSAIRIYMTSTLEIAFEAIVRAETQWIEDSLKNQKIKAEDFIDNELLFQHYPYYQRFNFYYATRNYSYIDDIFYYNEPDELLQKIVDSKTKWLIFVSSKSAGEDLCKKLKEKNKNVVFLNSDNKNTDKGHKDAYSQLIREEKFDDDVLISTSLLDNGINIDDDKLKNVVIDVFDRIEFVQMLGRIRIKNNRRIQLYIHNYKLRDLKDKLSRDVQSLISILTLDLLPNDEAKIEWFNEIKKTNEDNLKKILQVFRVSNINNGIYNNVTITYNVNAVYQFINVITRTLKLIRKIESDYFVNLNGSTDSVGVSNDKMRRLYNYYLNDKAGRDKIWSRSIVDLFTNKNDWELRKSWIFEEKNNKTSDISDEYIDYKYSFWYENGGNTIDYVYNYLIPCDINKSSKYDKETFSVAEQASWIERNDYKHIFKNDVVIEDEQNNDVENNMDNQFEDKICKKVISQEEYNTNKVDKEYSSGIDKFPDEYLKKMGIKNDTAEAEWISKNCCGNVGKKQLKDKLFELKGHHITIKSVQSKSNETYYLLVKKEGS